MQECQLKVDEQVKQELGLKLGSKWEIEMQKQLKSSSRDIPESLKHLATMPVGGLSRKVWQLENRRVRGKVRGRIVKPAAGRPGGLAARKYGGRAERLLLNAKQRAIARTGRKASALHLNQ